MSYHIFNNLAELLHRDLLAKIGRVMLNRDLMDRECNCSLLFNVNGKYVYDSKCRQIYIYEVKFPLRDNIYIGNTQQTFKKIMDDHFSDVQRLLKNGQK